MNFELYRAKNMRNLLTIVLFTALSLSSHAQKYFTKTGHIWFYSHAPLEDIEAHNYQVSSIMDAQSGEVVFKVTMTGFQFPNALMQEHFNEKYVESDKFPESVFKGKVTNIAEVDFSKNDTFKVQVEGELTIHGVTRPIKAEGTLTPREGKVHVESLFQIAVADYNIKIPAAVKDNIAKIIDIHVEVLYDPLK
ncbi:MAG: hypothetical protein KatS3mg031_2313 [Chitinophagales bacterium]|nr:MAG: hypothetical protein KatS3mg031_2313 [Chitinophagales bacterium]